MTTSPTNAIITSFGRTGSGKSYLGNQLTEPNTFVEGNTLESQTTALSSAVCWNGRDTFTDVPGYFDSKGRDQIQQANFIDYLIDKWVKVILFVFTDKVDEFIKSTLESIKQSDLKNNVILVNNKDLNNSRTSDESIYDGFPLIYVKAHQTNLDVLKRRIDSMRPVLVKNLPTPVSLYKQPISIIRTERVSEFHQNIAIPEKETVVTKRQVPVTKSREEWTGSVGKILGKKLGGKKTVN